MLNDYLQRVQVGRHKEVPLESLTSLWFIWYDRKGDWDSATMSQWRELLNILDSTNNFATNIDKIFAVWHGMHRTNLFLMDKPDLIERLRKMLKVEQLKKQAKAKKNKRNSANTEKPNHST